VAIQIKPFILENCADRIGDKSILHRAGIKQNLLTPGMVKLYRKKQYPAKRFSHKRNIVKAYSFYENVV